MARKLKQSWIVEYSQAIKDISEAPIQYNIWSALSVIGAVLKNKIWIDHGTFKIKPNMYVVLTGPPGVGKGTAMNPPYDLAKKFDLINCISDRVTAPKIVQTLAEGFKKPGVIAGKVAVLKDSTAVLVSTELPSLLSASDWMLPFLCDLWDRDSFNYDTKNSGTSVVKDMCVSLIGACVPDFIRRLNKDATAAINGGFTARTIFVYAEKKSQNIIWPLSFEKHMGKQFISDLEDDLKEIANLNGEVRLSKEAYFEYEIFKRALVIKEDDSDVVANFKSRMHVHVLKVAMILAACQDDKLIITRGDLIAARSMVDAVLKNLDKTFRGVGESQLAEATSRVQTFIEKKQLTTRNEILKNLHRHVSSEDLDRILILLRSIDFIIELQQGNKTWLKYQTKPAPSQPTVNTITNPKVP
jgi:hypothetical protein